ncbi:MAG: type II secretion system minor pseudopilin GspI [Pseudomonadota bacterium]
MPPFRIHRGFTLIEILVAMAILAIGMVALTQTSGNNANNAAYLRDKTFGMWVAENRLTDLQLSREWQRLGKQDGEMELAGQTWHWRTIVEKVADEETQQFLRAVTIEVRRDSEQTSSVAVLKGFIGNPRIGPD